MKSKVAQKARPTRAKTEKPSSSSDATAGREEIYESRRPRKHYTPRMVRTHAVTVYQPAIPIRCVLVVLNRAERGGLVYMDEQVLGIQVAVQDVYLGKETLIDRGMDAPPTPDSYTPEKVLAAGFRPEQDILSDNGKARHQIVLWSDEISEPQVLNDEDGAHLSGPNYERVIGPRDAGASWWSDRLQAAAQSVCKRVGVAAGLAAA